MERTVKQLWWVNRKANITFITTIKSFILLVVKITVNEKCTPTEQCNDLAGLGCTEGVCKCAVGFYWSAGKCSKYKA